MNPAATLDIDPLQNKGIWVDGLDDASGVALEIRSLTILIPMLYNPNRFGWRLPIGPSRIHKTVNELKQRFSGFTLSLGVGWCDEDDVWDIHFCFQIETLLTPSTIADLERWRCTLQERFKQRSIYLKISSQAYSV